MTRTPDIISFTPLLRSTVDDTAAVERLQAATLEILERVGVCFPCEPALEVFRRHGADVDGDGVVRLTPELVERALATAPRSFVLGGREPRFDLTLDRTRTYLSTEGVGTRVHDPETGEERSSRKADVELMARIVDALPAISFFWPPVSAQDHARTAPLHECHAGLTGTLKHVRGATTVHRAPRGADRRDGDRGRRLRDGAARRGRRSAATSAPSVLCRRTIPVSRRRSSTPPPASPSASWPCRPWARLHRLRWPGRSCREKPRS